MITALGSPARVIETVHGYGGLVFADMGSIAMARKAAQAGVDGLILVSTGADAGREHGAAVEPPGLSATDDLGRRPVHGRGQ